MKTKLKIFTGIGAVLIVIGLVATLAIAVFSNPFSQEAKNKRSFEQAVSSLSDDTHEIYLEDLTTFDWDYAYKFGVYTRNKSINEVLGFESHISLETQSEGTNNLVFVKDNKVVCRASGFIDELGFRFFDIGEIQVYLTEAKESTISYQKISKSDRPIFHVRVEEGIRYFSFDGKFDNREEFFD